MYKPCLFWGTPVTGNPAIHSKPRHVIFFPSQDYDTAELLNGLCGMLVLPVLPVVGHPRHSKCHHTLEVPSHYTKYVFPSQAYDTAKLLKEAASVTQNPVIHSEPRDITCFSSQDRDTTNLLNGWCVSPACPACRGAPPSLKIPPYTRKPVT